MNTLEVPKRILLTDKTNYILSVTNSSHKIIPVTSITIKYPIIYYIANNIVMASDSNRIVFMNIINGEIINSIPIALDRNLPDVIHNERKSIYYMIIKSFLITYNIKDNIVFYRQLSINIAKNNSIVLSSDETSVFVSSDGYIYQIDLDTRKIREIACFDTSNSQIRSISKDFFISVTRYNYPEMITLFDRKDGKKLDDMSILSFLISHEDLITTFLAGTVKVMRIIVKNNSIVTEQLISSDLDYISSSIFINRNMISVPPYLLNIRTGDRFHIHNTNQIISVDDNKLLVKEGNVYMYYKIEGHQISSEKINLHVSKGFPMDPDKKDIDSIRELVNKNVPLVNANIKKLIGNFIL